MKGYNLWSYAPYRPLLWEVGDIYICRVVPGEKSIYFCWLCCGEDEYEVFFRERGKGEFIKYCKTDKCDCEIKDLTAGKEYEFFVVSGEKKSRTRLALCAKEIGTVVNYLHPDDEAYAFSGMYLCSPSLVRHPDGFLLASMDVYKGNAPQNLTIIFRSDDNGKTWNYVTELMPCFWGKMFVHKNELYMLSCSTEYGDLLIGKSEDGGKTWCAPTVLLRGSGGRDGNSGVHKNPQNIVHFNGRIYESLEWGAWGNYEYCHAAMVMSCDENDDLLVPENWSFTEPKKFTPSDAPELSGMSENRTATIEGTLVISPENKLYNIMRFSKNGHALVYEVNTENHDAPLKYSYCMEFNAHQSKFMIKYDEISKKYLSIANYNTEYETPRRNYLVLMASDDLKKWDIVCDLIDFREEDHQKVGFQYVDFEIEGDNLLYLCRTAMNNAHNFHDANYSIFDTVQNFRALIK